MTALLIRTPGAAGTEALLRTRRRSVDRIRPGGRPVSYDWVRPGRPLRPPLPTPGQVRRRVTVLASALALLAVLAVGGLAALVAPDVDAVPTATTVIRVQVGESLSAVALRTAPGSASAEVVEVIRELNTLDGSVLRAGQSLVVPAG